MRKINLETWPRREHFEYFKAWDYPHFGMSANVDITTFYSAIKQRNISFTVAMIYVVSRAANATPEFRYRIRGDQVVEHQVVNPGITILINEDMFTFCTFEYSQNFSQFAAHATERIAYVKEHATLDVTENRDDWLYMTAIPWVSFTGFMHPLDFPVDSVPRIAWGKYFKEGGVLKIPLQAQGHHAVMDGLHMGRFFEQVQEYLCYPNFIKDQ